MKTKLAILLPDNLPMEYKEFRRSLMRIWATLTEVRFQLLWKDFYKDNKMPTDVFDIRTFEEKDFRLDERRNNGILSAMEWGATDIMFVDTDMIFNENTFYQLFKHDKPIVCGLYFHKVKPFLPQMYTRTDKYGEENRYFDIPAIYEKNSLITESRLFVKTKEGKEIDEMRPIHATGAGCMLIKREVFEKLGKPPYFKFTDIYDKYGTERTSGYGSEDMYFWDRIVDETDYKIHIDTSVKPDHIRQPQLANEERFEEHNQMKKLLTKLTKTKLDEEKI